jgi:hypothetical protein
VGCLRGRVRTWAVSLGMAGLAVAVSLGMTMQYGASVPTAPTAGAGPSLGRDRSDDPDPYGHSDIQEKQMKRLRELHQQELFKDTARMLQLATALKAEVDKGDQATLAADVLKQADEIGKLAKRVSDRIKTQ